MNEFIDHIREKYENDQEETEEYIDSIRDLCCNYESWFEYRKERIRRKNQ